MDQAYNNIGNVLQDQGNLEEAMRYYKRALNFYLRKLGEEHPSVAEAYNNMGSVLVNRGNLGEAMAYYQQTLEIYLKALGEEHPSVLW